ncbi:MAG: hypothetical protein ABGW69_03980, partial [Nanoarchaeota archaeon]
AELSIMYSGLKFNYKEYKSSQVLDSETSGFNDLKGIKLSVVSSKKNINLVYYGVFSYLKGNTFYNGATWDGTPVSGKENGVYVYNLRAGIGYKVFEDKTLYGRGNICLKTGIGYRYWNRGTMNSNEYNEKYKWFYGEVGIGINIDFSVIGIGTSVYYRRAIDPKLDVDLYGGTKLDLGMTDGYAFLLPVKYKLSKHYGIVTEYEYEYWKIRKSNVVNGIYEPESETKNQLFSIGFYIKY